jgi:hypothetical protein
MGSFYPQIFRIKIEIYLRITCGQYVILDLRYFKYIKNEHWIKKPVNLHNILPSELKLIKDGLKTHITIRGARATDIVINITMLCSWHS